LKSLRTSESTYVYAVAVNESITGSVDTDSITSIKALEQLKSDFRGKLLNTETDIYIRSADRVRSVVDVEYDMLNAGSSAMHIKCMMNALLYHNLMELRNSAAVGGRYMYNLKALQSGKTIHIEPEIREKQHTDTLDNRTKREQADMESENSRRLSNIFLDDDIFAEDKICRVI
jgi:DNA repair protein RadC